MSYIFAGSQIGNMWFLRPPIKRALYNKTILSYFAGLAVLFLVAIISPTMPSLVVNLYMAFYILFIIFAFVTSLILVARRLETLGYSPYWIILFLFPVIFIFIVIGLMFPGDEQTMEV